MSKSAVTNSHIWGIPHGIDHMPKLTNRKKDYHGESFTRWTDQDITKSVHTFTDDFRLEAIWRDKHKKLDRVALCPWAVTPDFTIETYFTFHEYAWQIYRSRLVGAYWQQHGVRAIPALQWGNPEYLNLTLSGLQDCQIFAVRSPTRNSERAWFRVAEKINAAFPDRLVLHFGTRNGLSAWSNGINLPLYSAKISVRGAKHDYP